jgi:hypothetical protein
MTHDLTKLGMKIRCRTQRPPAMPIGPQRLGQHKGVEAIVLAGCGLMTFPRSRRDPWTDREHGNARRVQPIDNDPVRALDRNAGQIRKFDQTSDQRVNTFCGVCVTLVEQLAARVVDRGDLMMSGTPIDASERSHDVLR